MKVALKIHKDGDKVISGSCVVTREDGDPAYYGNRAAAGESRLLYAIKKALIAQGFDVIKKRMWRDGHMMDDMQQYIRSRNTPGFCIFNDVWAVRGANEDFNKSEVTLRVAAL